MTDTDKKPEKHRMELPESLRKKRDEWIRNYCFELVPTADEACEDAWDACWTELQPIVEALRKYANHHHYDNSDVHSCDTCRDRFFIDDDNSVIQRGNIRYGERPGARARQALQSLEGE